MSEIDGPSSNNDHCPHGQHHTGLVFERFLIYVFFKPNFIVPQHSSMNDTSSNCFHSASDVEMLDGSSFAPASSTGAPSTDRLSASVFSAPHYLYQGLPTITVRPYLTVEESSSSMFADVTYFAQWYNFVGAYPMTAEIPDLYQKQGYCVAFVSLEDLLTAHNFTIDMLKQIASHHSVSVPYRVRKTNLITLLKAHTCIHGHCCIYVFKMRGNGRQKHLRRRQITQRVFSSSTASSSASRPHSDHDPDIVREIEHSKAADFPKLLTSDERNEFLRRWNSSLSNVRLEKRVCASCSRCYMNRYRWFAASDVPLHLVRNIEIPESLQPNSYDRQLYQNAILHPSGLRSPFAMGDIMLCPSCHGDLCDRAQKPKYALSNWLYYAHDKLPTDVRDAFDSMTPCDLQLITRASASKIVHRYSERDPTLGDQRYSKGNALSVSTDSVSLHNKLPPTADEIRNTIAALFVGSEAPTKENLDKIGPVLVSKSRVKILIDFLIDNNPHYEVDEQFVGFDQNALDTYPSVVDENGASSSSIPAEITISHLQSTPADAALQSDYTDRNHDALEDEETDSDLVMENVGYTSGDLSQTSFTEMKIHALEHCLAGRKFVQSRRASSPLADFESKELLSWLFPHLDPWGIGSFFDPRRTKKLDMREQLVYLLSIVDSPFERDPNFTFFYYNILQKKANLECTHFRIGARQQRIILNALKDLRECPQILSDLSEKFKANIHYKPSSPAEKKVVDVLNKINMVPRDSPGSVGYKQARRNEIRGLINKHGAPSLFITINPSDVHHPLVRMLAGQSVDLDDHTNTTPISKTSQRDLVANNPAAAARFFNIMMENFINILLCNNLPGKSGIGIFGRCTAYYGMVEAQGKGTLHCHMLVWLDGHLSPQAMRIRLEEDDEFRKRMFTWLETNIRCQLLGSEDVVIENDGPLPRPPRLNPHPTTVSAPQPDGPDFAMAYNAYVNSLVVELNWHVHTFTCWKYLKPHEKRTDENCRMRINGTVTPRTHYDSESQSVHIKRLHPRISKRTIHCYIDSQMHQ
jgi:hypothetical protein